MPGTREPMAGRSSALTFGVLLHLTSLPLALGVSSGNRSDASCTASSGIQTPHGQFSLNTRVCDSGVSRSK